jgi:copper transport protein
MRGRTVAVLACLGVLACAPAAGAHALLRGSVPAGGAVLRRAPTDVTMMFTEAPEPSLSSVAVLDSAGRRVDRGRVQAVAGHPLQLRVPLGSLPDGVYTVTWRTVSRVDGHVTGGSFAFGIGVAPSVGPPQETNPPPSVLYVASRWALYLGLSGLVGVAWVWTAAFDQPPAGRWTYPWSLWGVALAGVVGLGLGQASDAGVGLVRLLTTPLGAALWWRLIPLAAAGAALAAGARRPALLSMGLLAAGSMLADVLAGHAAAIPGSWRWPTVVAQWAHFMSIGVWLGGLAALLMAVGQRPSDAKAVAARRFSTAAGFALGATALTGVLLAISEVSRWSALTTTDYGRLVLVKAGLLTLLAALGAVNRYRSIPRVFDTLRGLRRVGAAELTVALGTLAIAGTLTGFAPPREISETTRAAPSIAVQASDFATSVRAHLTIFPGYPGENRFTARIVDYDTGRPITADRVTLRFSQPGRPDVGASVLVLRRTAPGMYQAQGTNLSLDGRWSIVALVERGLQSTEVPFTVTARVRPEVVHTISAPGQPTLYSIDLPGGRTLDAYLDPDKPGLNEVHATFIDASGGELPVPRPATITVARLGQPARALPVRRFGPGHFIGDARLGPGDWHVEITATARDGSVLRASLTVHL